MAIALMSLAVVAFSTPMPEMPKPSDSPPDYVRPMTVEGLRRYLLGNWRLRKATTFVRGGMSGKFDGDALFDEYPDPEGVRTLVAYSEFGQFCPKGVGPALTPSGGAADSCLDTRNRLLYDFTSSSRIDVFFDASADRTPKAVISNAQFLHSVRPDDLKLVDHSSQDADEIISQFDMEAPDAFLLTYTMKGAKQEGDILSIYNRMDSALSTNDA